MSRYVMGAAAASLILACGSIFGPETESRLGALLDLGEGLEIIVPDSASVRVAFDIEVRTQGNGCVSFGSTEVEVSGRRVDFRPFDLWPADDRTICTTELKVFEHRASVQFDEPGPVAVRIHGMIRSSDGTLRETVIELIRELAAYEKLLDQCHADSAKLRGWRLFAIVPPLADPAALFGRTLRWERFQFGTC